MQAGMCVYVVLSLFSAHYVSHRHYFVVITPHCSSLHMLNNYTITQLSSAM